MRVLYVDDDDLVGGVISSLIEELGHDVTWCTGGIEALDRLSQNRYDLLLTDVRLGRGGDGRSLAQLARDADPGLPVIFVTGDIRVRVRHDDILVRKPCTLGMIEEAIGRAVAR